MNRADPKKLEALFELLLDPQVQRAIPLSDEQVTAATEILTAADRAVKKFIAENRGQVQVSSGQRQAAKLRGLRDSQNEN